MLGRTLIETVHCKPVSNLTFLHDLRMRNGQTGQKQICTEKLKLQGRLIHLFKGKNILSEHLASCTAFK